MKTLSPDDCAQRRGVTRKDVMKKVFNTLAYLGDKNNDRLPPGFRVRRLSPDNYIIYAPDDYQFTRLNGHS